MKDEDPCGADLGLPDGGAGLDLCGLLYGHGGMEDHIRRWHGRLLHHQGGSARKAVLTNSDFSQIDV